MKSFHLGALPLVLALTWSTNLFGQERTGAIRLHRQPATVSVNTSAVAEPTFPAFTPPGATSNAQDNPQAGKQSEIAVPALTVTSSLAIVLGLFAGLVWLTRKFGARGMNQGVVPKDVLMSLGSTPIDSRTRITLLRCGKRILVVAQSTGGIQPLSEISDPDEVRELTAACRGDSKHRFDSTLHSLETEKTSHGFVDTQPTTSTSPPRSRGRLFAAA